MKVHHDIHGFYILTDEEVATEMQTDTSVGFDGRPHFDSEEEALAKIGLKRFKISETVACWVTYERDVIAPTKGEAVLLFREGGGEGESADGPLFGDNVDGYNTIYDVDGKSFELDDDYQRAYDLL